MTFFWVVVPCSLVEVYQRFRGTYWATIALMMETASTFETSVNIYQTTRRNIPEESHLRARRCENLKSQAEQVGCRLGHRYICRTERGFNYLWDAVRRVEARNKNGRIAGCVMAKGKRLFRIQATLLQYSATARMRFLK
jgi:hypothetical protein